MTKQISTSAGPREKTTKHRTSPSSGLFVFTIKGMRELGLEVQPRLAVPFQKGDGCLNLAGAINVHLSSEIDFQIKDRLTVQRFILLTYI